MSHTPSTVADILVNHHFHNAFQPIYSTGYWNVYAYESLFRTKEMHNLEYIFQEARHQNRLFDLDILSIRNSIVQFEACFNQGIQLFVNIFPSTILNNLFPEFLKSLLNDFPAIKKKLVFELSETIDEESAWDMAMIQERIQFIKEHGLFVALDDVGKGAASLRKIIEFQPDYIKLDQYFSSDLHQSTEKQEIISLFVEFCSKNRILILEGIEQPADLAMAKALKVPFVQGYLLGKPESLQRNVRFNKVVDL